MSLKLARERVSPNIELVHSLISFLLQLNVLTVAFALQAVIVANWSWCFPNNLEVRTFRTVNEKKSQTWLYVRYVTILLSGSNQNFTKLF